MAGGLTHVSEAQAQSQTAMLEMMERRLADVQAQMQDNLAGSSRRTAQSLGELQERLQAIDKALRVGVGLVDHAVHEAEKVFPHPRHTGELGSVRNLVKRKPQPEITGWERETLL